MMNNNINKTYANKRFYHRIFIISLFLILIILFLILINQNIYSLQNKFIEKIVVAIDHNYPPFIFRGDDGILKGYLVDLWREWEKVTKVKVVLYAVEWSKALNAIKEGNADIIDTVFFTEERAKIFTFSKPYFDIKVPIIYSKNISGLADYDSLKGFIIGAKKGDAAVEYLQKNGITNILFFNDYKDIIAAAKEEKIKVFTIDEPCAIYYLNKYGILENYKIGFYLYTGQFHRAVIKGNEPLLEFVENGFNSIPKNVYRNLKYKWFGVELKKQLSLRTIIIIFSIVIVIILFFLFNSLILTNLVKKRTLELQNANEQIKKEKEFLENLFKIFPDIVITFDKSFNESNSFFPLNFEKQKNMIKEKFSEIIKDEYENNNIKNDGNFFSGQYDINIDNKIYTFDVRIVFSNEEFFLFLARDITEKKNIEKNILQKQKLEVIGTLTSGLAHDMNNVFHSILNISSLIKMMIDENNVSTESLKEYSDILEKSSIRGTSIISSLLSFTKDSGSQKTVFNVVKSIINSIDIFNLKYKKKVSVNFKTEINDATIYGSENQIMQVILNMMINSYESIEKKGDIENSFINIYLIKNDNFYEIQIEDNGIGIEQEHKNKIFDPFFTTKGQGMGTGVGLTIAQKIILEHNGKIEFKSDKGQNTIFSVFLPLYSQIKIDNDKDKELINKSEIGSEFKKYNILIVDDDPNVLRVTQKNLGKKGFNIFATSDPKEAFKIYIQNKEKISLCILDLVMPDMSGLDLLKLFISNGYKGKVIICTGYKDDQRLYKDKEIKIDYIIEKPYQIEYMYKAIIDLLN